MKLGSLKKRVVKFFEDDYRFKHRHQGRPAAVRWKSSDLHTLREARLRVEQQAGLIRMSAAGVDDSRGQFVFTHESYFEFILKTLHAVEQWQRTGQLEWASPLTYTEIDDG
jgi:hypothetical protein